MVGKPKVDPSRWPEIVERYHAGKDCADLGAEFGVSRDAIYAILRRSGCQVEHRGGRAQTPPETEAEIVRRYAAGEGSTSLAREFGVTKRTVFNILNRSGVGTRPRSDRVNGKIAVRQKLREAPGHQRGPRLPVNEHAFDALTDEAAYWIGYLICDGHICVDEHTGRSPRLQLVQGQKHIDHMRSLLAFMGSSHAVSVGEHIDPAGNVQLDCSTGVSSSRLVETLGRYGVRGLKPTRSAEDDRLLYHPHFWRGCVDADGSMDEHVAYLYLSGHRPLLSQWASFVSRVIGRSPRESPRPGCLVSFCPSTEAARQMASFLYVRNAGVCLPEKASRARPWAITM